MKSKTNPTSKNTSSPSESGRKPLDVRDVERVKLDLLSLVSHELRTPLTSILNAVKMLREGDLSTADRGVFLDMAVRNAEKLNMTLNQLLDLSKLVSGRLICRFQEVGLQYLFKAQIQKFEEAAEAQGLKLRVAPLPDLPVILGDGLRLEEVIYALFENAVKFSPKGGRIDLEIKTGVKAGQLPAQMELDRSAKGLYTVLELSNPVKKGAAANLDDVFQVFAQREPVLNRIHEGVGGSLAICREVVRQHGGGLHIAHAPGAPGKDLGRFTVLMALPRLESEQALLKVLGSRIYAIKTGVGAVSLMILEGKKQGDGGDSGKFMKQILEAVRSALFRASDSVYSMPEDGAGKFQVAVVMDDCKKADAPKIVARLLKNMSAEAGKLLKPARVGLASCPEDSTDPEDLLAAARKSLLPIAKFQKS